jgi:uncharacterized protein (TIGR00159 family)
VPEESFIESIRLSWRTFADLFALAVVVYSILRLTWLIRAFRIAVMLGLVYAAALVAGHLDLPIAARVLEAWVIFLLCLVAIVFQPEIRRALVKVDAVSLFRHTFSAHFQNRDKALAAATFQMARERTGALVVILNSTPVDDLTDGGLDVNADVSAPLLSSLFQKTSPVHDGAVLLRGNVLLKVNVVLPLTERTDVPRPFGTRHRAAMGIAERSDAVAIAVSEERGEVTVFSGHREVLVHSEEELIWLLSDSAHPRKPFSARALLAFATSDWKLKMAALLISAIALTGSAILSGNSERVVTASVEFDNLGHNLDVVITEPPQVNLEVRGRSWLMDRTGLSQLAVHVNLNGLGAGPHVLPLDKQSLALPPGLRVIQLSPLNLALQIESRFRPNPRTGTVQLAQ